MGLIWGLFCLLYGFSTKRYFWGRGYYRGLLYLNFAYFCLGLLNDIYSDEIYI